MSEAAANPYENAALTSGNPPPAAPSAPGRDSVQDRWAQPDPDKFALVRKPGGGTEWVDRATLPSEAKAAGTGVDANAAPGSTKSPDGTNAPQVVDGHLVLGEMRISEQDARALMERHALEQSRKATLPATADAYELRLPADFKVPEGQEFKWSTDHPVLGPLINQAREFAAANGLSQETFSKMMGLYAASVVHENNLIAKAAKAELDKLGATATVRVDALATWLRGVCGDRCATAIRRQMHTADFVEGLEKIAARMQSGGAANFTQAHRVPDNTLPGRVTEEAYAAMSQGERLAYSQSFDQRQFNSEAPRKTGRW